LLHRFVPRALVGADRATRGFRTRFRRTAAIARVVHGEGIEIGAAVSPAAVPPGVRVTYVDRYPVEVLREDPELAGFEVPAPDVIDRAEELSSFADDSLDFVLAFSVLEHVEDPIGMLRAAYRVVRPGGAIVVSAPDKRYINDVNRELTPFEHLVRDTVEGPAVSREAHFREVGRSKAGLDGAALEAFVAKKLETSGHTHFHVWDARSFLRFATRAIDYLGADMEIIEFAAYDHECLLVLEVRKGLDPRAG
jgi:predicted SAM-dependent methyltransferase